MLKLSKRLFLFALSVVFLASATVASAERRLALVIGNSDYQHATPLRNPTNDARAMAGALAGLGFDLVEGYDLSRAEMDGVLRQFAREARQSDINVFFYAGHGMSVGGTNYLVPTDAEFLDDTALDFEAVPVDFILRQMSLSDAVNLVFLDACRDNPLSRSLSRSIGTTRSAAITQGLSEMKLENAGTGVAIAFATSPGEVAFDGDGVNSPFTEALLRHIGTENADITQVLSKVTGDVYEATDQAQRPWLNTSLTGPVVLNKVTPLALTSSAPDTDDGGPAPAPSANDNLQEQKLLFDLARETGAIEDYQAYLDTFPKGLFANNARRTIQSLRTEDVASLSPQVEMPRTATRSINEVGPLVLSPSTQLTGVAATKESEDALGLDRTARGNIQSRLNTAGFNVGGVDGKWGANTRRGLKAWQSANGLIGTGFLNSGQLDLLVSQTEGRYQPYTVPVARAKSSSTASRPRTQQRTSGPSAGDVGAFFGSVIRELNR